MSDAPSSPPAPGSDLTVRFAMGVAMAAVACLVIWFGGWPFRLFVALAAVVMFAEWCGMHKAARGWAFTGGLLLAAGLLGGIEYLYPDAAPSLDDGSVFVLSVEDFYPSLWAFAGLVAVGLAIALAARRLSLGWGLVYIGIPSFALMLLSWTYSGLVFWVMVVTWATDIFAYFAGRAIGGPKLAPKVSPNKTWAGLVGGMAGAGLAGWGLAWYFELGDLFLWIGAPMGAVAQAGDLYESWVKRRHGVKDSGTILPGHGGVLDRLDGLLAVAVVTMILLLAGLWAPPPPPDIILEGDTAFVMHVTSPRTG